ncbi:MAG: hypothetical protein Q4D45_00895 [Lachnospiraceae bacterium]|nr:hypothetical protein [Lachnospiraceae bacterium]
MRIIKKMDGTPIQILTEAMHPETRQTMIVYQELSDPFEIYVIEAQKFEDFINDKEFNIEMIKQEEDDWTINGYETTKTAGHAILIEKFLDAESYKKKIHVLESEQEFMDEDVLELLAATMDEAVNGNTFEERYDSLMKILQTKARFEFDR